MKTFSIVSVYYYIFGATATEVEIPVWWRRSWSCESNWTMPELGFQDSRSGLGFSRSVRDVSPDSVIYTGDSNFSIFSSASGSVDRCSFASDAHDQDSSVSDVSQVLLQLRFPSFFFFTFHSLCLVGFSAFTCIFCYSCSVQYWSEDKFKLP